MKNTAEQTFTGKLYIDENNLTITSETKKNSTDTRPLSFIESELDKYKDKNVKVTVSISVETTDEE